jgi:predicted Zn-dependent peptidase
VIAIAPRTFVALVLLAGLWTPGSNAYAQSKKRAQGPSPLSLPPGVKLVGQGSAFTGTGPAYKFLFDNGLRLIVLPDDRNPVASLRFMLDAGSDREVPGKTGLAHFFEHMMFRKTRGRDEGLYDRTLSGVGGRGNASTSTDYVNYESTFPGPALDTMLDLEARRFRELDLQDPWFSTEKGAVVSERKLRYENDPAARAQEILRRAVEKGTPYEWLTIGLKADIEAMTIPAARAFYADHYTPDNTIISVGGPFPPEVMVRKVHQRFGDWKGKAKPRPLGFPKDYATRHAGKEFICGEAVFEKRVNVVFPSPDVSFEASVHLLAVRALLDDDSDGTFAHRLVKRKIATGFSLYKSTWQRQWQPVIVSFRLTPSQVSTKAEKFFHSSLEDALEKPVDDRFRAMLLKRFAVDEADQSLRMTSMLQFYEWNESFYGDFLVSRRASEIIAKLDSKTLRAFARKAFHRPTSYRVGVFPTGESKACAKWEPK